MRVAHLLRKLNPAEWSGTEMAVYRLLDGLRQHGVSPVVYCPKTEPREQGNGRLSRRTEANAESNTAPDPFVRSGFDVRRFRAFVPVLGLSKQRKRQLIAVGGNLMSFDLLPALWRQKDLAVVHAHTMGRIGGIGLTVAKRRRLPFVITIHGGLLDLPDKIKRSFNAPMDGGLEWGKLFGVLFQSHRLLRDADAILTCNPREAALLQQQLPDKRIRVQPHGVPVELYRAPHAAEARAAFPQIADQDVLLCLGRIDPIKNQLWLIEQAPRMLAKYPNAIFVLVGPCTDESYGRLVSSRVDELGLAQRVLLTGGLPSEDPRLIGLLQLAKALILPSLSETFGLVILEAWAAGTMVLSVPASGPAALIEHGENGWFFKLDDPQTFHDVLDRTLSNPARSAQMVEHGARVAEQHSVTALAGQLHLLYQHLVEEKQCVT